MGRRLPFGISLAIALGLAGWARPAAAQGVPEPQWLAGVARGPVGVLGFATYQLLNVEEINAAIEAGNKANGTHYPTLPSAGFAPGFGVVVGLHPRWAFTTAGHQLTLERREADAFSRLRIQDTKVGLYYLARSGPGWRLLAGGLVGLAAVEFEYGARQPTCRGLGTGCLLGDRWSRLMLSLQPELVLQLPLGESAGLLVSAGYLLTTDFWNPEWADPMGQTHRGQPAAFSGPLLRMSLVVGSL